MYITFVYFRSRNVIQFNKLCVGFFCWVQAVFSLYNFRFILLKKSLLITLFSLQKHYIPLSYFHLFVKYNYFMFFPIFRYFFIFPFSISHSPFPIPHSPFPIPRFSNIPLHYLLRSSRYFPETMEENFEKNGE